jgi:hypothetical protein
MNDQQLLEYLDEELQHRQLTPDELKLWAELIRTPSRVDSVNAILEAIQQTNPSNQDRLYDLRSGLRQLQHQLANRSVFVDLGPRIQQALKYLDSQIVRPEEIVVNGIWVPFIKFDEAIQKIQSGKIITWNIDPSLQSRATLGNTILTLVGQNGNSYLLQAQYDPQTYRIYPSV